MPVTQVDKIVDRELYTVLQIESGNDSPPIALPETDHTGEKLMAVLRKAAPEYFTERHRFWSPRWKKGCEDSESEIMAFNSDICIYSKLNVKVFAEKLAAAEASERTRNACYKGVLGWSKLAGETLAADAVKTLLIQHELGGYKDPEFDHSDRVSRYSYDGTMPNLDTADCVFGPSNTAYEIVYTALLTGRSVSEVCLSKMIFSSSNVLAPAVGVDNPTAERVEKAARELRKFSDYVSGNKEGIILAAAQVYNALAGNVVFARVQKSVETDGASERIALFAREAMQNATNAIDHRIANLPPLECSLMQYLHDPFTV